VAAVAVAAQGHQIPIAQYAYQPGDMTVRVGETVTWTNQDQAPHDVVTTAGPAVLKSPLLSQGQSWSFTFTLPGTYDYYCSVHPDMRARITVLPEETTTVAAPPPVVEQPPAAEAVVPEAPAATTTTTAVTTSAPAQVVTAAAPPQSGGLDTMLLLAGLVAAVTTFCLLLIGSRPEKR
jgi:amicyanin